MFVFAAVVFFTILAILWLRRITRNDQNGLTDFQIVLAFSFKVLMGCAYGYIFLIKYDGDDTWSLHEYSLGQQDLLIDDPWLFFTELNPQHAFSRGNASPGYYYLADLETWMLTKPFAFLNFLTGGNYYVNIVFFNIPVFIGQYWFFGMLREKLASPVWPVFAAVFLVPPVVFWLSGLRADGILFFMVILAIREFSKILERPSVRSVLLFFLSLAGILILRSIVLILLVPPLVSWLIVVKTGRKPIATFVAVYGTCIVIFIGSIIVLPGKNAASAIIARQMEFFELEGNTRYDLDTLKPTAISFIKILPQAFNNTFLRPYPWEAKGALQYATVLDVFLLLIFLCLLAVRRVYGWRNILLHPFSLSILCFAVSLYLVIGYIVPFPGAIVRYKIIGEVFILAIMAVCIDWSGKKRHAL